MSAICIQWRFFILIQTLSPLNVVFCSIGAQTPNSIMAAASPGFDGSLRYDLGRVFLHEFSPTSKTTEYEDSYDGLIERDIFDRFSRTEPRELTDGRSEFDYFGGSSLGGGSSEAVETTSSCDLFGSTSGSALGRVADFLTCLGRLGVN
jgi:hypothetical protein